MAITQLSKEQFKFTAHGFSFKQNPMSPKQFAFVASANELIRFCGVARKSQDLLTNYQRALDTDRVVREVTPFFRVPENCSPTAIVLSLQETNVCQIEFASTGVDPHDNRIEMDTLTLKFIDLDACDEDKIVELAKQFLDQRLEANSTASPGAFEEEDVEELRDDEDPEEIVDVEANENGEDEEESTDDATVEIGQSMLQQLRDKLDEPKQLTAEMIDSLREMLKPALVIDGQHRLFGAAGVEEDIPLLVCSLVQPSWKEQVFQFVVVNDKAAGIPKPFITSLAGMSLTGSELDELRERLTQAGLKLWEVEVMQRLGYDAQSPFHDMIEFKVSGGTTSGLGYQTMKRVGRAWYHPRSSGLYNLMQKLYCKPGEKKLTKKAARARWQQQEDWFEFFCLFWNAFKEKFEGTEIWEVHSHLLTAVVVEMLQADFLIFLDTQEFIWDFEIEDDDKRRIETVKRFRKFVSSFVDKHKPEIYTKEWGATSLSHKDGKKALADLFRKVREGRSLANHPIFTGNV